MNLSLYNKLYQQHYPLVTEEDKNQFLSSNCVQICKILDYTKNLLSDELHVKEIDYIKKMKRTISLFGTPKYQNILHNRIITDKMCMDKRMRYLEKNIRELELLENKIISGEYKKISIEEINDFLKFVNSQNRRNKIIFFAALLGIILCVCIVIYW